MSCPYFYPTESRGGSGLYPLGDRWAGPCRAQTGTGTENGDAICCNLGYARGQCPRFPEDAGPDAVRFTVTGADDRRLLLYYVVERDHHPFAHGPLEYSFTDGVVTPTEALLAQQARAYAESYRRRKGVA